MTRLSLRRTGPARCADRRRPSAWWCPGCAATAEPPLPQHRGRHPGGGGPGRPTRRGPRSPTCPPAVLVEPPVVAAPPLEVPEPTAGRLVRLRARLSRSQNVFGKGLLALLSRDQLDEDTWEEIEETPDHRRRRGRRRPARSSTGSASGPGCSAPAPPSELRGTARRGAGRRARPGAWTARCAATGATAARRCCWWSASTAPARPPPAARSPGCWSPTGTRWCSAPPTRSGPPPPTSWPPGAAGWAPRWSAGPRAATRPRWRSTRSSGASTPASTPC